MVLLSIFRAWRAGRAPGRAADSADAIRKVLDAHARTIDICEACAVTTRDLAAEVKRGGVPNPVDLQATIVEAERVLGELAAVRAEIDRLRGQLR